MKKRSKVIVITIIELVISILSLSSYSLWTDEGIRLHAVVFGQLKEVIHYGLADKQLLFVLKQYYWTRIFGTSEIATRSLNLIFVLVIIYFLNRILITRKIDISYGLLLFISPMFVYYMNDAGPYIILLAYSLGFLYYVFFSQEFNSKENILKINLIFLLGVGTHFIFGFVYVMYLVKVGYLAYQKSLLFKRHFYCGLLFSPVYLTLLFFYIQAIESGASRGWEPPNLLNLLFVIYSFIGSAGLSFSRNDIRAGDFSAMTWDKLVLPVLLIIVMSGLFLMAFKHRKIIGKGHGLLLVGTFLYGLVFYLFSYKWHFHFWERHFIMAYAVFMIFLIEIVSRLLTAKGVKLLMVSLASLLLISSMQLRFNAYYGKDNYKDAIHYVLSADKPIILYQGDWKVSNYYGLEALPYEEYQEQTKETTDEGLRYVIDIRNKTVKEIEDIALNYPNSDVIIVFNEKYDSFKARNSYKKISDNQLKEYNTFSIFKNDQDL